MYRRSLLTVQLLLCVYTLLSPTSRNIVIAQTAQQIAKKVIASTVLLVMENSSGQQVSLGTGFFVRAGEVATNYHVIEGATRGYAKLVNDNKKYEIEGITARDPNHDLVLVKIGAPLSPPAQKSGPIPKLGKG